MTISLPNNHQDLKAWIYPHTLIFTSPAATSKNTLTEKPVFYLFLKDTESQTIGIGECSTLSHLSPEHGPGYREALTRLAEALNHGNYSLATAYHAFDGWPSIQFGLEQAYIDWQNGGERELFNTAFTKGKQGIPINGLIWMNDIDTMRQAMNQKLADGFRCLKLKVGALNWDAEINLIKEFREQYDPKDLEIRVDANGAFHETDVMPKLEALADLGVHSIEQPLPPGSGGSMAGLCQQSPIPIALDEELIGHTSATAKKPLLDQLQPSYIVLKPSLIGGFQHADEWIQLAKSQNTGWWATSALESNIGLNAIAQWTSTHAIERYQGLGTGGLYTNNIPAPLFIEKGDLFYNPTLSWNLNGLPI